jgi:hypothetical protein
MANCGPVALGNALGVDPRIIRNSWPSTWKHPSSDMKLWVLPLDTPWHHIQWFTKQGYTNVLFGDTWEDFVAHVKPERTVVLLHKPESPLLKQHWARIVAIDAEGFLVDMQGSNRIIRRFTHSDFKDYMCSGWPFSYYVVGGLNRALPKLTWWQRLLLWITK